MVEVLLLLEHLLEPSKVLVLLNSQEILLVIQLNSHGLTQKPVFILWKILKQVALDHWGVYHSGIAATKYVYLNLTNRWFTIKLILEQY